MDDGPYADIKRFLRAGDFAELPEKGLMTICETAQLVRYAAGDTIMKKGEEGKCFYMIVSGTVGFSVEDDGTILRSRGPNEQFGEIALLNDSGTVPATAIATTDAECYVLRKDS